MLLQQVFRCPRLLRRTLYPDAVVTVTEARIVTHHHRDARNARVYEKPGHRRQSTDQHHHFESKNRIRNPGRYRLSTDNEWPPVRYPDRDPVAEGATEQSADERESTHATRRRADGFLELVTRCRCEDPNSTDVLFLQRLQRINGGIELVESGEYSKHQANSPGVSGSYSK